MKNIYILSFITCIVFSNVSVSQEVVEVEETIIESTETDNTYSRSRRNVKNIYKKGEHFLTGNIDNEIYIIKNNSSKLYGLQDYEGNLLVRPMFKSINKYSSSKNRIVASLDYSKNGVIDRKGEIIIPFEFSSIISQKDKQFFILGRSYSNYEIVNYNGKPVLNGNFERITVYDDNIKVKRNDAYGVYKDNGEILLPIVYDKIDYSSSYKYFSVTKNGVPSILTNDGENLFKNNYEEVNKFGSYRSNEYLVVKNNKKGVINLDEQAIIPIKFDEVSTKSNYHLYTVKENNLWGVYDSYFDKYLIKPVYQEIHQLSKTQYLLTSSDKKIIRNIKFKTNTDVTKYNFNDYYLSNAIYLKTKNDNKYGLININTGKLIVPTKYDRVRVYNNFISGYNELNKKYTAYSSNGKITVKDFNNSKNLTTKLYKITKKGKAGLIYDGNLIADVKYDIVTYYRNVKLIILVKNSNYSLLDHKTGKTLIKDSKNRITINSATNKIKHNNKYYFYSSGKLKEE